MDSVGFDYNKSYASFAERSQPSFQDSEWDITLQWGASDDTLIYAKYGNGYKAGGFDELQPLGGSPEVCEHA